MGIDTLAVTPFLTLTLALPVGGAALLAVIPAVHAAVHRWLAFAFSLLTFAVSLSIWVNFDPSLAGFQLVEDHAWLLFGARYTVGVDGISLLLVMLTTFLTPITLLGSFSAITRREKEFYIAMLLLESAMVGTLVAIDLLLFYVFWEVMLVPMYLIIGVWGGERRILAAVKFFLFTAVGSILMLVGILYLYVRGGLSGFSYFAFLEAGLSLREQFWLFAAFGLAFAIKVPLWPFHTWLPDAHVEAPTAGSVILAGVLLKLGTYGFLRFAIPLFPEATGLFSVPVMILAACGVVFGSLAAMAQQDVKKLVAYSSVAHLGLVMLGLFSLRPESLQGGLLQMVNHGISTGALFLAIGMLYERRHTRKIDDFGGLARPMPGFAAILVIVSLSSIGLPGTNGFVGEFLVLSGVFSDALASPGPFGAWNYSTIGGILAILGSLGIVLGAVYLLGMLRRVLFGPITADENRGLRDMRPREWAVMGSLVFLIFWIGIYPSPFLSRTEASSRALVEACRARVVEVRAP